MASAVAQVGLAGTALYLGPARLSKELYGEFLKNLKKGRDAVQPKE